MGWRYAALEERFRRLGLLQGATAILEWDTAVMMPQGAVGIRAEQLAALRRVVHEELTAEATGELIAGAREETAELDPWQAANLREIERRYRHARAIEPALVAALTRAATTCEMIWREARAKDDFAMLAPHLERVLELVRESATLTGTALGVTPYDALLDAHQPDLRDAEIAPLFDRLAAELPPLVDRIIARQEPPLQPAGPFPLDRQRALARELMERLGFDFAAGRLDESAHPFCGGVPGDLRLTTRYREDEIASAMMAVLHETGHALYEAGLPERWRDLPVGEARGIAVHESQALLFEMQACRSPAFIRFMSTKLEATFGAQEAFAVENLERLYHKVARTPIRVDADEATYPLHVILRWRLERALLAGDLRVDELPGAWGDAMMELLGFRPKDDREGCLQDIHWPVAAFGYFPCYTLGALFAAQLFARAHAELPGLDAALARGEFEPLRSWIKVEIHGRGSLPRFPELVAAAAGGPLAVEPFLAHLAARYRA
jgi:carboxypeptidase Taq